MILNNETIKNDFDYVLSKFNFQFLKNKTIMVTGSSGFLGSLFTAFLCYCNSILDINCNIVALDRKNEYSVWFAEIQECDKLLHIKHDVSNKIEFSEKVDYIIHTANPTQSTFLKNFPIETTLSIMDSMRNVLDFAKRNNAYVVNFSSMEVYGSFGKKITYVDEDILGSLDIENMRNSYPLAKRMAEFLCNAYVIEQGVKVSSVRLAQTIGPGIKYEENKVFMMMLKCCIENRDIQLATSGKTTRSLIYSADVLAAVFCLMEKQISGIFNVANEKTTISVYDLGKRVLKIFNKKKLKVIKGGNVKDKSVYMNDVMIKICSKKLEKLGWKPKFDIDDMFIRLNQSFYKKDA